MRANKKSEGNMIKKKEWDSMSTRAKLHYAYNLGIESCQGLRKGKSADKEIEKIILWETIVRVL
jgi:hypothetical protein